MGWAPYFFHTGLCFFVGILTLINFLVSRQLLLDNEPLSLAGITIELCALGVVVAGFLWDHGPPDQKSLDLTATRSQVRGLQHLKYFRFPLTLISLGIVTFNSMAAVRGEGSAIDMDGRGVSTQLTKIHVKEPRQIFESHQTFPKSSNQKRSYRRALNRIKKHGYTWYRGRLMSGPIQPPTDLTRRNVESNNTSLQGSQRRKRLTCFSWNCGGMSQSDWMHFQQWLSHQQIDIITLQESHWPFCREWVQEHYYCMHSGVSGRQAGLLTMVARSLCSQHSISWHDLHPGRLMHVRLHGRHRSIDIINIYQHVFHAHRIDERLDIWHSLHDLVSTLPKRNTWYMVGDFNTSLTMKNSAVGLPTYLVDGARHRGPIHSDASHLNDLLKVNYMTALNAWNHQLGPTYKFLHQHSRIDFQCVQLHMADTQARDVHYLHDFPLLSLSGAEHVPLLCSIRKVWFPDQQAPTTGWTRSQRKELYIHWKDQDSYAQTLHTKLLQTLHAIPEDTADRLDAVHNCMNQVDGPTFSKTKATLEQRFDLSPFKAFQHHTTCLRALHGASSTLRNLFQAWFHHHHRSQARRQMNVATKAAHKRKLQLIYDVANQAEQARDHFGFYQAIRDLAPKQQYQRIQLRSKTGALLDPGASADLLQQWYAHLYDAQDASLSSEGFEWPFSADELSMSLQQLPAFKALASSYAPAPMWKMVAPSISEFLHPYMLECGSFGTLPKCWSHGELTFLPKPGKKGCSPAELRPIALLEPTGKCALGLFASHLFQQVSARLFRLPQFAYLGGRGGDDALRRVSDHCQQVRTLMDNNKYSIHHMAQQSSFSDIHGGLMLSLDLTKAFDCVSRSKLFAALKHLHVDENLIRFLANIYTETYFSFHHRGHHRTFPTKQGIRQGCKAAPILWACYAAVILEDTAHAVSWEWILQSITVFADDFCLHCLCNGVDDVKRSLTHIGKFLDILTTAGLTVNMSKTVAVYKMAGRKVNILNKQYVKRTLDGTFLCVPCRTGPVYIRLVKQFTYLGVVMGYSNFPLLTVKHRIKAGTTVTHQLSRWLHKQQGLSPAQKLRLWYQCTFPSLIYGIRITGIDVHVLQLLDQTCMQHIRRIFRAPVHITQTSHADFLTAHNIADPLLRFRRQCEVATQRETQRFQHLASDDILRQKEVQSLEHITQVFEAALSLRRNRALRPEADLKPFQCDFCFMTFENLAALRRHLATAHGHRTGQLRPYHVADSAAGVPTCVRCSRQFSSWTGLQHHVRFICLDSRQEDDDPEHRLRVREFLQYIYAMNYVALGQNNILITYFLQRCIICGHFVSSVRGLLMHWGREHNDTYRQHGPWNDFLNQQVGFHNPCVLCGTAFRRMHHCPILRQCAMYMQFSGQHLPREQAMTAETFPCNLCSKVFVTRHGLQQHLRRFHEALQASTTVPDDHFDAYCLIAQAVEQASCAALLEHPAIAELMSQQCLICYARFGRRNELMRHFRTQHAAYWHRGEHDAIAHDARWKLPNQCYCFPVIPQRKHLCLVFIQYALLRIQLTDAPDAPTTAAPADLLLQPSEIVKQLAWLGLLNLLVLRPALKLALSVRCQLCDARFTSADALMGHLRSEHTAAVRDCDEWIRLLHWVLFAAHGCMCNPAVNHGSEGHICPLITQLALLIQEGDPITIPWSFRATDLMDVFGPLLSGQDLIKVTTMILARQFDILLLCREVHRLLVSQCLICHEAIPLHRALEHVRACHHFNIRNLKAIIDQLARVAAAAHPPTDFWCEHCGKLMPSIEANFDITPQPEMHMRDCPYIALVALMLAFPMWHHRPFEFGDWPSCDEVDRSRLRLERQLSLFNVGPSAADDVLGLSFETLALGGLAMVSDPTFLETLQHRCLMCGKVFFTQWKFLQHLMQHDFRQLDTYLCYHRLQLRSMITDDTACPFCAQFAHLPALGYKCLPLLHLAIFLTNGSPTYDSRRYLEERPDARADGFTRDQLYGSTQSKETQIWEECTPKGEWVARPTSSPGGQAGAEDGRHGEPAHAGAPICVALAAGARKCAPTDVGSIQEVASGGEADIPPPRPLDADGRDCPGQSGDAVQIEPTGAAVEGLPEQRPDRCTRQYALSSMVRKSPTIGTVEGRISADTRCGALLSEPSSGHPGSQHHATVPQFDEGDGHHGQGHPVAVALKQPTQCGGMARDPSPMLSLFLATDRGADPSTIDREDTAFEGRAESLERRQVRILANPGNSCYFNASLQCLLWITLCMDALHVHCWPAGGFELFRSLSTKAWLPLCLRSFQPLIWLLGHGWQEGDLFHQQDACEFLHWFLARTMPTFVNNTWAAQHLRDVGETDLRDGSEKGSKHGLIQIHLFDHQLHSCTLQHLIDHWNDALGLCRAAIQADRVLILQINRFTDLSQKCMQQIEFGSQIRFPVFQGDGTVHFFPYVVTGFLFHLGATPNTGHYRSVVRYNDQWLAYEDDAVPERYTDLPAEIRASIVLFMLLPLTDESVRRRARSNLGRTALESAGS